MELIERYLQAIGRALPATQKADILSELRSALLDALENSEQKEGELTEEERVITIIKEMGSPQEVADAYYPNANYLIGPQLYPLFKLVLGIVFTTTIGAQLLIVLLSFTLARETPSLLNAFWGIFESLPFTVGMVVVIFWGLQKMDVQPDLQKSFNPEKLPPLERDVAPVSRGEKVLGIILSVLFLVSLASFAQNVGFAWADGRSPFENPVIDHYFPWIGLSLLVGIVLDIVLLWYGRWQRATRLAAIGSNLFSLSVLLVLIRGHSQWLAAAGLPGLRDGGREAWELAAVSGEVAAAGMTVFYMIFLGAAVLVAIETTLLIFRLLRSQETARTNLLPVQILSTTR